jgi:hypothetical protein
MTFVQSLRFEYMLSRRCHSAPVAAFMALRETLKPTPF